MREELTTLMGGVKRMLNAAADLILLNVLLIVGCIPVVTAGAAGVACYAYLMRIVRGLNPTSPIRPFWTDFRKAFRVATPAWLLVLLCFVILAGDYYFAVYVSTPPNRFFLVFAIAMAVGLVFAVTWLFPLIARYENTLRGHIRNAFLMAAAKLPKTLAAVAVQLLFYVVPLFVPQLLLYLGWLWLLCGLSLPMYITVSLFRKELDCIPMPLEAEDTPNTQNRP